MRRHPQTIWIRTQATDSQITETLDQRDRLIEESNELAAFLVARFPDYDFATERPCAAAMRLIADRYPTGADYEEETHGPE
jgi:hypothetical protein